MGRGRRLPLSRRPTSRHSRSRLRTPRFKNKSRKALSSPFLQHHPLHREQAVRATRPAKPSGSGRRGETECSGFFILRNARKVTTKCLRSRVTRSDDIGTTALSFLGTITGKLSSSAAILKFRRRMRIPTDRAGVLNSIRRLPKFNPIERFPEQYPRLDAAREARGDAALIEEPGSHVTRWWREQDSNPRSPVARGGFRFGEEEVGRGHPRLQQAAPGR